MDDIELKMDNLDIFHYTSREEVKLITRFKSISFDEYLATRCLIINSLLCPAYLLAQQAIEKLLKCVILTYDKEYSLKRHNNHEIQPMIKVLEEYTNRNLSEYDQLCENLFHGFQMLRYPDNYIKSDKNHIVIKSEEIQEIDKIYFALYDIMNLPLEIKYLTTGLYNCLTNEKKDKSYEICVLNNIQFLFERKRHEDLRNLITKSLNR